MRSAPSASATAFIVSWGLPTAMTSRYFTPFSPAILSTVSRASLPAHFNSATASP